ncbi:MAG TPA: hypothetical protein VFQ79_00855 [Bryobacteraceae bacterium]|nr:hypothetical protein [Bryobacteraceae bacterium]
MIRYVRFLRDKAARGPVSKGFLDGWYTFHEVKQNWLGFSKCGNNGSGLGPTFARAMHANLNSVFKELGLLGHEDIILIDARKDNKPSASVGTRGTSDLHPCAGTISLCALMVSHLRFS